MSRGWRSEAVPQAPPPAAGAGWRCCHLAVHERTRPQTFYRQNLIDLSYHVAPAQREATERARVPACVSACVLPLLRSHVILNIVTYVGSSRLLKRRAVRDGLREDIHNAALATRWPRNTQAMNGGRYGMTRLYSKLKYGWSFLRSN